MTALDELARRLRATDLQLPEQGEHLGDERLACIAEGADPTDAEAQHLAGCDECLEVLTLLGPGLAAEAAPAPAPITGWPGPPTRRLAAYALLAFAGVAAASLWVAQRRAGDEGPVPVQGVVVHDAQPPDLSAPDLSLPDLGPPGVDAAPPDAGPADAASPVDAGAPVDAAQAARRPRPPRARPRQARPPRPAAVSAAALAGAGGMRGPTGRPVNGPPRGYGFLRLTAKPPARVFVDGKPFGWTPLVDRRLPEGPHDVRLVFDSPLAAQPEQRLRVIIEPDRIWKVVQDNRRGAP